MSWLCQMDGKHQRLCWRSAGRGSHPLGRKSASRWEAGSALSSGVYGMQENVRNRHFSFYLWNKTLFQPTAPRNEASVKDLVPSHISDVSRKWPPSLNNLSSPLHNFLIFFFAFWLFTIDEEVNGCWSPTKPVEHPSHQSIKKHLPYIQHDLFLVNTIVSLYPSIIIPLIPLAIHVMLTLKLTPKELGREREVCLIVALPIKLRKIFS